MSSFFAMDVPMDHGQRGQDQSMSYNNQYGTGGPPEQQSATTMNQQLDMDLLGNLMAMQGAQGLQGAQGMQGVDGQQNSTPTQSSSAQYNPQMLLEHQFKLTQLQQLQQLQNQIFQQQAS